ncbi:MAG TPA: MHYT domain-containing protein [Rhizomicrobium sp.]|nr:MHYT domain-containing protein [Rhizomicrobium sp.]
MIRVLGCIFQQHDLRLVVVAAGLCLLACGTALTMISRARAVDAGRARLAWLAGAGAVAGCGIWGTHFVAMLAYSTGLPLGFATGLTIASALIAMSLCGAGFALAVRVSGALGGMVTGFAISAMHYTGMAAVELPARAVWDIPYVIASVLIGVCVSGLALHFALRRKSRRDFALGAGLFTLAIVGLHFTAMAAVRYVPDGSLPNFAHIINPFALAVVVAAGAAFIVSQGLVVAIVDRYLAARAQGEALRMRNHIAELETTQKALEKTSAELAMALDAAEAASKSKSAFLASMSHELRTPLNAVIGFADTMMMEVFGPVGERYKSYAADIRNSGAHLLAVINDVLDLSRLDAKQTELQEEIFDPAELVSESLRMMAGMAKDAQIEMCADIGGGLPWLKADKRRIKQILINLMSNALKFTPPGGEVQILARQTGAGMALAVRDTGIGIAPEDIPKALERFGQVDSRLARKYEGTGLGLPLSKLLAELHGGALVVESAVGVGTTVTVNLPPERLAAPQAAIAAA